jgi:hypothetical protein
MCARSMSPEQMLVCVASGDTMLCEIQALIIRLCRMAPESQTVSVNMAVPVAVIPAVNVATSGADC